MATATGGEATSAGILCAAMAIHWATRGSSRRRTNRIGGLFAIGSLCFIAGPAPGFVDLVGSSADRIVFLVGSIFFTSAALLQFRAAGPRDRTSTGIQLAGTLCFNVSTLLSLVDSLDTMQVNRLVWAPDAFGSTAFLISAVLAYQALGDEHPRPTRHSIEWRIAAVNLLGCILFAISAVASFVVPETGTMLDFAAANWSTALGALGFLIGSLLLIRAAD